MKRYDFLLDKRQASYFFSPIRNKSDLVRLLMEAIKVMLVNLPPDEGRRGGKIVLMVDKMSRLIFSSNEKTYSINFPFFVDSGEGGVSFYTKHGFLVDSRATSYVLALLSNHFEGGSGVGEFFDDVVGGCEDYEEQDVCFWTFIRDILVFEDGYLRVDYDEVRQDPEYHPLNHIDIFYSSGNTFKLGLEEKMDVEGLIKVIDLGARSYYLK